MKTTRVAVLGASGYTGAELLRILFSHPGVTVTEVCTRDEKAGMPLSDVLPSLTGVTDLALTKFDAAALAKNADFAFCALPHGASAPAVKALLDAGVRVLDLSADFRLRDAAAYAEWYGAHPATELLESAVYGLPELHRAEIAGARLVAVPGCYPTSATLALAPLLHAGLVETTGIIVDSKSGVSGAGRTPTASTHLPETAEGLRAYKVAGQHRHTPEIEQELSRVAKTRVTITFTPHLAPMTRGILTTAYATARPGTDAARCEEAARALYAGSPSVRVLSGGRLPDTLHVRGSNFAHLSWAHDRRAGRILGFAAIDNLVKGAAGQAVQCLNVMTGRPEGDGLTGAPVFP
jgi:N-acetyl-gamma-glutamyl-phosphate reductase